MKISVIGRGTVGCLTVIHYLRWTNWHIDWIYDPSIETTPVGEGTTLQLPKSLDQSMFLRSTDLDKFYATPKLGLHKKNWGLKNTEFYHGFSMGTFGIHFNAVIFQKWVFDQLKDNKRITFIEDNIIAENVDSDYIISCIGSPKKTSDFENTFKKHDNIPVNACLVSQCSWNYPQFLYTVTHARKHGWIFGIPLQNRCAIGYLYNSNITSEEEIKNEVNEILEEFNLKAQTQRAIKFNNYSRINNWVDNGRIVYNGNASYFLEPLEATSTGFADRINRQSWDFWNNSNVNYDDLNESYANELKYTENMIMLHYLAGSKFNTPFWEFAKNKAIDSIQSSINEKNDWYEQLKIVLDHSLEQLYDLNHILDQNLGSWDRISYKININGLGIESKLREMM